MFSDNEMKQELMGLTVKEVFIAMQLLNKAAANGVITPQEFELMGEWRKTLTESIKEGIGVDYDQRVAEVLEKQSAGQADGETNE